MIARFGTTLLVAFTCSFPAFAAPFHHSFGEWREYNRDWLAACPDAIDEDATDYYGFSCFASTGSQELNSAGLPAYKLTIFRNRLNGDVDIAITVAGEDGDADTARPMVLSFGGEDPVMLDFQTDLETRHNTINQYYIADPALSAAVLAKMKARNAATLTVPLTGDVGSKDIWLSMRGVAASIDFMSTYARRVAQY